MIEDPVARRVSEPVVALRGAPRLPAELTVVVPSYNESGNLPELVRRLDRVLEGIAWEIVVVDDNSPDGTHALVKAIATEDPRVRCLRRVGRRGLSGACVEGILSSAAPVVAVMDSDLQHDETLLPRMLDAVRGGADLVVGSRYVEGGTSGEGLSGARKWGSEFATRLARAAMDRGLKDPMSGFFMVRREIVEGVADKLARQGYKILLDLVWSVDRDLRIVEIPFTFRERQAGESKLDSLVTAEYLGLLLSKLTGGFLPVRFLMFLAVGASGVVAHLAALKYLLMATDFTFEMAQFGATIVAMTWNYVLNNQLTYADRRLRGVRFVSGLLAFYVACSIGAVANVGVASWIHGAATEGPMLAGLAGALMGAVFNYAASSVLIWKER